MMDRLEEIRDKSVTVDERFEKEFRESDKAWLISEVERLKKENKWLIKGWARARYVSKGVVEGTLKQEKKYLREKMQQAIEEETPSGGVSD